MSDKDTKTVKETAKETASRAATTNGQDAPSGVVRHLGLIKALAVIMAVLIVAALVVIVVTIYSRLAARDAARDAREITVSVPAEAVVTSAEADKSGMTMVLDTPTGQQIWRLSPTGKPLQKILVQPE